VSASSKDEPDFIPVPFALDSINGTIAKKKGPGLEMLV
jgi:hypothetical protein